MAVAMRGQKIIVGVTGGIAAYKTADLVSKLAQRGDEVAVVMTPAAKEFITEATMAALSGRPVACEVFDSRHPLGAHIELARWADVLCVAPATASFLGSVAHGIANDLLTTLYLSFEGLVLFAPAMNVVPPGGKW